MSLDGINGRSIQTLLRGENDSKQSDEFQATSFCLFVFWGEEKRERLGGLWQGERDEHRIHPVFLANPAPSWNLLRSRAVSTRSHRPKPFGQLMKFTKRSILYCFYTTLRWNSAQQMLIKVYVSSISKEKKNILKSLSGYRTRSVGLMWTYIAKTLTLNRS